MSTDLITQAQDLAKKRTILSFAQAFFFLITRCTVTFHDIQASADRIRPMQTENTDNNSPFVKL